MCKTQNNHKLNCYSTHTLHLNKIRCANYYYHVVVILWIKAYEIDISEYVTINQWQSINFITKTISERITFNFPFQNAPEIRNDESHKSPPAVRAPALLPPCPDCSVARGDAAHPQEPNPAGHHGRHQVTQNSLLGPRQGTNRQVSFCSGSEQPPNHINDEWPWFVLKSLRWALCFGWKICIIIIMTLTNHPPRLRRNLFIQFDGTGLDMHSERKSTREPLKFRV